MSVSFEELNKQLSQRIARLDCAFERHFINIQEKRNIDKYALQEGFVSALWQAWCIYCKNIFFGSIRGGVDCAGNHISTPQYAALSDYELFYLAKVLSNNQSVNTIKQAKPQNEPTWGDVDKLSLIFTLANTPNANTISAPLSGSLLLKDLQMVRNASAHITKHTVQNIHAAKVKYSDTQFKHPSDAIFWVVPSSSDFLWKAWVKEIKFISTVITK